MSAEQHRRRGGYYLYKEVYWKAILTIKYSNRIEK